MIEHRYLSLPAPLTFAGDQHRLEPKTLFSAVSPALASVAQFSLLFNVCALNLIRPHLERLRYRYQDLIPCALPLTMEALKDEVHLHAVSPRDRNSFLQAHCLSYSHPRMGIACPGSWTGPARENNGVGGFSASRGSDTRICGTPPERLCASCCNENIYLLISSPFFCGFESDHRSTVNPSDNL